MFCRYSISSQTDELSKVFKVNVTTSYESRYNAAPTHVLPVITNESPEGFSFFYWGARPDWAGKNQLSEKIINTFLETSLNSKLFQKRVKRRCIIPADGFYLWKKVGKKSEIPYRFILEDQNIFCFCGIWEEFEGITGQMNHTFSIITTKVTDSLYPDFGVRFPLILTPKQGIEWLDAKNALKLLVSQSKMQQKFHYYPVSSRVNFIDNNDIRLIQKSKPFDQFGNLSLFD